MSHYHSLRVSDVRRETADCISVAFEVPAEQRDLFAFKSGQHLGIRAQIDNQDVRRSYSICRGPQSGELRVAIKKLPGGVFSTWAHEHLQAGMHLDIMPPMGRFSLRPTGQSPHFVGIAAGSGITPIFALIEEALMQHADSRFTLLFVNKNTRHVIFREAIEDLKNRFLGRFQVWYVMTREKTDAELFNGRLDADKVKTFFTRLLPVNNVDSFYLCGPEAMVETARETLTALGAPTESVHFELFGTGAGAVARPIIDEALKGQISRVKVNSDGLELEFELGYDEDNLLDAAMAAGADLPFSCKGGVCATCKARLVHGDVHMHLNYSLEADELAQGYILTCQSYPRSADVSIDFDSKHG
jgi:ring-1,2-phenylacetyl-CoA epoxidase subunit PaaE